MRKPDYVYRLSGSVPGKLSSKQKYFSKKTVDLCTQDKVSVMQTVLESLLNPWSCYQETRKQIVSLQDFSLLQQEFSETERHYFTLHLIQ